jgi:hypothetical protein
LSPSFVTLLDEALVCVLNDGGAFALRTCCIGGVHVGLKTTGGLFTGCEAEGLVEPPVVVGVKAFAVAGVRA